MNQVNMHTLLNLIFLSMVLLLAQSTLRAQAQSEELNRNWTIQALNSYSQTGWSTAILMGKRWNQWELAGGIKFLPLGSLQYLDQPYGGVVTLRREMASNLPWHSFVLANLEFATTETYCPLPECEAKSDYLNEFLLGYGLQFDLGEHWLVWNSISTGLFHEYRYGHRSEERFSNIGFNGQLRLGFAYRLP